jgi:hypothetical protein
VKAGHGICACAAGLQESFRKVYDHALSAARAFITAGAVAMRMENRDVNWNIAVFSGTVVVVVSFLMLEVKP